MSRREFSKAVKREALRKSGGFCKCGARFAVSGVHFDHIISDSIGGEPTLENCEPLCLKCHRAKTDKIDTPRAAKTKRQADKNSGIKSHSRFQNARSGPFKTRMDGKTVRRTNDQ